MNLEITFNPAKKLSIKDKSRLEKWFEEEFSKASDWDKPQWYVLAKNNNKIIGRLGIMKRKIKVGSHYIWVGGVSGVTVILKWRKQIF